MLKLVRVHGKEHQLSSKEAIGGDMVSEKLKAAVIQVYYIFDCLTFDTKLPALVCQKSAIWSLMVPATNNFLVAI